MLMQDLYRVLVPDETVVLYDRYGRKLERCFPDEINVRYLGAEVKSIYSSGYELHVNLRYGSFK